MARVHRGPALPVVHEWWTKSTVIFHWEINLNQKIPTIMQIAPCLSAKSSHGPQIFKKTADFLKYFQI
jgi:hypothetical protein